jgi:hypothetical protein
MVCPRRLGGLNMGRSLDTGASRLFRPRSATVNRLLAGSIMLTGLLLAHGCGGKSTPAPRPVPVASLTMKYKPTALTQEYRRNSRHRIWSRFARR